MILACHQPNFLPWIGFFDKMAQVDYFVLLDDVELPDGSSWANRTRIKTPSGPDYLTLPIHHHRDDTYRQAGLAVDERGLKKIWKTIHHNYARSPHFGCFGPGINEWLASANGYSLSTVNTEFIFHIKHDLGIRARLMLQSSLRIHAHQNELIIALCKELDCDVYLSGQGARDYNDRELLAENGIELRYQEFTCPEYDQPWGEFCPNLSIIDLVFNCGGAARDMVG